MMLNGHDIERQRERLPNAVPRLPPFSELIESTNRSASIVSPTSLSLRSRLSSTSSWPLIGHSRQPSYSVPSSLESSQFPLAQLDASAISPEREELLRSIPFRASNACFDGYTRSMPVAGPSDYSNMNQQTGSLQPRLGSLIGGPVGVVNTAESVYDRHEEIVKSVQLASKSLGDILFFQEMLELKFNNFMELQFAASRNGTLETNGGRDPSAVLAFEEFILYFSMGDLDECVTNSKNVTLAVENIKQAQAEYYQRQRHFASSATDRIPRLSSTGLSHQLTPDSQALVQLQHAAHQLQNFEQGARDEHIRMIQSGQDPLSFQQSTLNKENFAITKKRRPPHLSCIDKNAAHSGGEVMNLEIHVSPLDESGHSQDYGVGGLNSELSVKPNIACQHCGSRKTPEWRRGPDGSRTLCNACGLFYSKMIKKYGLKEANMTMKERKRAGLVMDRHIV